MRKRVEAFIKEQKMIELGERVIAAVSGGADSVCLLYLLAEMRESLEIELRVVHVHHGLRGAEADRDAAFVEETARRLGLSCLVACQNVWDYAKRQGMSVEEAGRALRYQVLEGEAAAWGGAKIAVAHHREDQAETILHNLFRGSGLKGLGGMSSVRGAVIRPLLCVGRLEILDYLEKHGIGYCEDSTNKEGDYTRNRLRLQLIPEICRNINRGAIGHIVNAGEMLRQADQYFEEKADEIWRERGVEKGNSRGIDIEGLNAYPEILRRYVIRKMLHLCTGSMKDITMGHVEQLCRLTEKGTGKKACLPYDLEARIEYNMLWVSKEDRRKEAASAEGIAVEKSEEVTVNCLAFRHFPYKKSEEIPGNWYTKWFDYDKIKGMLSVRTRQSGDYITLKGGKRKSVKAYMIDEKIPRQRRDSILLLAEGSHILWIVGYRISEYYKITESTQQILQVQADGGEGHGG